MTMTKPSELVAMYILGTDDEATVIHLLSSYIRQGSRKEVFDSIKVKLKKGNVSEQIKVVQLMDDLVQQTAMHSTAVLSAETWMQRLWKIFKNTKSNELQNAMHHVVVRWAGVYGYRTLAQMAQRMEYHLHPELKKARSIQKQRSFLNPSSHADASKIEQFFIQLHEDTAKFEVALQRPELMNDHLAQKMVHHHEHLIAILEHDNLAENIRLILKNEENQIGELLEVGCAIFGEDFFLEVGVPPGTASSSEQRKKSTSQHRTLPANIVALHESIRHLQVQIDYEKEEEKNSMDRIAELDHEIQLQQTTGSMTRSMSSSAVPQAQQTASASRKKAQMVKKNYLLSQIRTMSKSVAHARDELNDLKVYYKQLVSQQKGAFQKLDRILAALPRALAQEQNTEQNVHMRLKELYLNERRLRQQYFNTIQDLKGSLRRFCRIRPREQGQPTCLILNTRVGEVILNMEGKPKRFEFDSIFPDSQEEIFEEMKNLVDGILNGYNVCFATYGATGSGKSYTLFGEPSNVGLLHRTIATIFHGASERQETLTVEISAFEITQKEDILDLLTGQGTSLELVRSGSNLTCITDLSSTTLRNADNLDVELCGLLERLSSISPASIGVCQVQIETKNRVTNLVNVRRASFIDMCAVSETDNGNSTKPLINAFQVTLTAAAHASAPPSSHVSSKLLTYMQDYTREMGKLALILCLDGSVQKVKQTHATLQFGARCCA